MNTETNLPEVPKLSGGLKVLTILTFIGCAIDLYNLVKSFIGGNSALKEFDEAREKLAEAPAWARRMLSDDAREMLVKSIENRIPMLIIGIAALGLCLYGAIQMRQLKKQGYWLWLAGEILPVLSIVLFIGGVFFKTIYAYFLVIPVIFIILYTVQRKNLVY